MRDEPHGVPAGPEKARKRVDDALDPAVAGGRDGQGGVGC